MNNPLGVSPSKGNQGKSFDLGGTRTHDLRISSRSDRESRGRLSLSDLVVFKFPKNVPRWKAERRALTTILT